MTPITAPTPEQVAQLRAESGLTAEAFGALVYVGAPTVYGWEAGRKACGAASWELLLVYFGKAQPRTLKTPQPKPTPLSLIAQQRKLQRAMQAIQKAADSLKD